MQLLSADKASRRRRCYRSIDGGALMRIFTIAQFAHTAQSHWHRSRERRVDLRGEIGRDCRVVASRVAKCLRRELASLLKCGSTLAAKTLDQFRILVGLGDNSDM